MYPDQDSPGGMPTPPSNNYDFIVNPAKPPRKSFIPSFGGNSFLPKIILIVGGAIGLMVILWIVTVLFGGGTFNTNSATSLVQSQQEIVRVAEKYQGNIFDQNLRNASANTMATIISQQNQWITLLSEKGHELKDDVLELKENTETDQQLDTAVASGTLDDVYFDTLQTLLVNYSTELETYFNQAGSDQEKELLSQHYQEVVILLEQLTGEKVD